MATREIKSNKFTQMATPKQKKIAKLNQIKKNATESPDAAFLETRADLMQSSHGVKNE